ncbi:PaaI family thioesterase [uncultured Abyssibacter sp.]|uniref:PaaI family thioesterase n=1 Tax=uncultured Abyssibacter sp. TaxID=2320202 RepID=UPI0032B25356
MTTAIGPDQLCALFERVIQTSPYTRWSGVTIERCTQGEVVLLLGRREEMTQHHGYLHGAVIGYLIDSGCAWAAATVAGDVVTASYNVNVLAPATAPRFRCVARVVKAGRKLVFCRAEVFGLDGDEATLVATGDSVIASVGDDLSTFLARIEGG